jgi:hypothetical protein
VLLLTQNDNPTEIAQRFAIVRKLQSVSVDVGPDRKLELHLFFLRGFLGYNQKTYLEQSGTYAPTNDDGQ